MTGDFRVFEYLQRFVDWAFNFCGGLHHTHREELTN